MTMLPSFFQRLIDRQLIEENVDCPIASPAVPSYSMALLTIGGIPVVLYLLLNLILLPKRRDYTKKLHQELLTHAVITGGSSGIGLSIAKELVNKRCQYVTLLARNEQKLDEAKNSLKEHAKSIGSPTIIQTVSVDVSNAKKIQEEAEKLCCSTTPTAESYTPIPTMLFNVAGTSSSASFIDTEYEEFDRLMNVNYLGTAYATRAFLPYMKSSSYSPRSVIITSSMAGQCGVFGFTAYSASKFALRGLAEALHMEVARDNISVQIAYPPDTDTPGFELEQIDKPEETRLISEVAGLFQPDR